MVKETGVKFNSLEKEIYRSVCKAGCELLATLLEEWDRKIEGERDKSIYRHKGRRATSIKTLMGVVEYKRTAYEVQDGGAGRKRVYLLDALLERETVGTISAALAEQIVEAVCETPYRKAAQAVSKMTGQDISPMGAWNVVQALGTRLERREEAAAVAAKQNCGKGRHESKMLFEEQDGIWLKLQGEDRKKYGQSRELKLSIAYDGAKKTGTKRYRLQNKVACANFEEAETFFERKEGVIADYYAVDEIETRILGGDGAKWIRHSQQDEASHFQLDTFHRNRAIVRAVKHSKARKAIFRLLYDKQIPEALEYIEILSDSVAEEERRALLDLHQYLQNNEDGLIGYHRRGLDLPEPPEGVLYRRLGAMESNVFSLVGSRMKRRRAAWSIRGGNNLARLLCLKTTGWLKESVRSIAGAILPPEYTEEVTSILSAGSIQKRVGEGYNGFHHFAPPCSRSWLKDLMAQKPLSSITLQ